MLHTFAVEKSNATAKYEEVNICFIVSAWQYYC